MTLEGDTVVMEEAKREIGDLKPRLEKTLSNLITGFNGAKKSLKGMRDREKEIDNIISDLDDLKKSLADLDDAQRVIGEKIKDLEIINTGEGISY